MDTNQRIAELEAQLIAKDAVINELRLRVEGFELQIAELNEKLDKFLKKNSSNSHLPPSSDGPGARVTGKQKGTDRKQGGQHGHKGHKRDLVAAEKVTKFVEIFPPSCNKCRKGLPQVLDIDASRFQVVELPPVIAHITEYRCHAVTCTCGHTTRGDRGNQVPSSSFGPQLMGFITLLTGVYHLSRRQAVELLGDVLGIKLSLGSVSKIEHRVSDILEPVVTEISNIINEAPIKHTDATTWLQGGSKRSLWTLATPSATLFKIFLDGCTATIKPFFGSCKGILVSDRATVFSFWEMNKRQICWAHLKRKFVEFSEQKTDGKKYGDALLEYTSLVFQYWHDYCAGKLERSQFISWMVPVRAGFEACLQSAVDAEIKDLSGSCLDMLDHKQALWTFVETSDVEPTNNHAERELRSFVLWRKCSFGSQSDRGDVFSARVMSVARTARKQNKSVFAYLAECCISWANKIAIPSIFAQA